MKKQELEQIVLGHVKNDAHGHRDICSIYSDRKLMKEIAEYLAEPFRGEVDYVAAPESLGFILGSMLADELGVGFVPIRNGSYYPLESEECVRASYIDHRNKPRMLQIRKNEMLENSRILLVDDWIETAATMYACTTLVEDIPAVVKGIAAIGAKKDRAGVFKEKGCLRAVVTIN